MSADSIALPSFGAGYARGIVASCQNPILSQTNGQGTGYPAKPEGATGKKAKHNVHEMD
jgi:hypothetical protein